MLVPTASRTWAPRGVTPRLRHRYSLERISAISAITVCLRRHRLGLDCHFHFAAISHVEVAVFLRLLLHGSSSRASEISTAADFRIDNIVSNRHDSL